MSSPSLSRSLQSRVRIGAQRDELFLAAEAVPQAPPATAVGRHLQVEPALVAEPHRLHARLEGPNPGLGQHIQACG